MTECPSQQLWLAVLEQRLPTAEEEALARHAEACAACQHTLEAITCPPALSLVRQVCDTQDSHLVGSTPFHARFAGPGDTPFTSLGASAGKEPAGLPALPGYALLAELGRGGMGVVFKARHLALNRLVALKMLHNYALADAETLARFHDEARAVARLQHPGIVQIHEVGTLEGQPYLALEYVPGQSLDRVLQVSPLAPRAAADLLLPLAEALQAAHARGILHRDLKPANVLLQIDDCRVPINRKEREQQAVQSSISNWQSAIPKITDFGLAKPLHEDHGRTESGIIVGTPSYMAPEQAAGARKLGPATDVYALGAILYECLTGRPPFRGVTVHDTVHQVLTEEPVAPRQLQSAIPRDLETICLKCLHKESAKRYATAQELADDVRRFVDGRPILARPATPVERVVKWCRRYPAVAALLVVTTLAAAVAVSLAAWALTAAAAERQAKFEAQQQKAKAVEATAAEKQAKELAQQERDAKERQRQYAQAIADFVRDDFLALTSLEGQDRFGGTRKNLLNKDTTLQQLLDRAADKLRRRHDLDPSTEAELCWIIGVSYRGVGEFERAISYLERSVTLFRQVFGPDADATLTGQNSLAVAYSRAGQHDRALPLHEKTLQYQKARRGLDHPDTLASMNNLAVAYEKTGQVNRALPLLTEALKLHQAQLGPDHLDTLQSMNSLAMAYDRAGKSTLALPLFEETLQLRKGILGPTHPDTLTSMHNLADSYWEIGKHDSAVPLFEETLKLRKAKLGSTHPDTLLSMGSLANAYGTARQHDRALPLLEETFKLRHDKLGPTHPDTLRAMSNVAAAYWMTKQLDKSIPMFEEAVQRHEAKLGRNHVNTLRTVANLGVNYLDAGRLQDAVALLEEVRRAAKNHPDLRGYGRVLVSAYAQAGEHAKLTNLLREELPLARKALLTDSPQLAGLLVQLGMSLLAQKQWSEAEAVLRESLTIRSKAQPGGWTTFNTQSLLGAALLGQKKYVEAEPLLLQSYAGMKNLWQAALPVPAGAPRSPGEEPSPSQVAARRQHMTAALDRLIELYQAQGQQAAAAPWQQERKTLNAANGGRTK